MQFHRLASPVALSAGRVLIMSMCRKVLVECSSQYWMDLKDYMVVSRWW